MGIQLSLAKSFVQLFDRDFLYQLFKEHGSGHKKYRIYVPLPAKSTEKLEAPKCIVKELLSKNYEVHDYASGLAKHAETKKFCKIGKLLSGKTLQQFANDPARQKCKECCIKKSDDGYFAPSIRYCGGVVSTRVDFLPRLKKRPKRTKE